MANETVQAMDQGQSNADKFIIISVDPRTKLRDMAFDRIREAFGEIEIIAPEEERMIRPRRKSRHNNHQAIIIKRPIFYQYVAINWHSISFWKLWHLRGFIGIWNIFLFRGTPAFVSRQRLLGMLQEHQQRSWEGQMVEVMNGPLKGKLGKYIDGRIEIELLGRNALAKVSVYNLRLAD